MRRPAAARPAADRRLWLVLLLLAGLLGMHGLASDHASAAPTSATLAVHTPHATEGMAGMTLTPGRTKAVPGADRVTNPRAEPPPEHAGMVMAGLCLAVLTGGLLLLALAVRRDLPARASPDDRRSSGPLAQARALPPPRPPDLVAGMCVSRT